MKKLVADIIIISGIAGVIDLLIQFLPFGVFVNDFDFSSAFGLFIRSASANFIAAIVTTVPIVIAIYFINGRKPFSDKTISFILGMLTGLFIILLFILPYNKSVFPYAPPIISTILNLAFVGVALISGWGFSFLIRVLISRNSRVLRILAYAVSITVIGLAIVYFTYSIISDVTRYRRSEGPNIIIISFDALRRDYVSVYNDEYVSTPNIDYVAGKGYKFENSFTNSPWTLPALMTLNSGQYPSVHGIHKMAMPADVPMIADILRDNGYRTEAYIGNEIVRPGYNFDKGFDRYEVFNDIPFLEPVKGTSVGRLVEVLVKRLKAPSVSGNYEDTTLWCTEKAIKRIEKLQGGSPYFLWVHYLDPHTPLTPPDEYITGDKEKRNELSEFARKYTYMGDMSDYKEKNKEKYVELYAAEVRYADDSFGEIVKLFDELDVWSDTVIVVTSDHGEEHFEHGRYDHNRTLYDEIIAIPIIVYFPDLGNGVIESPVSLIDIPATVLSYLDIEERNLFAGNDLMRYVEDNERCDIIYADRTNKDLNARSVRDDEFLLVYYTLDIADTDAEKISYELYRYKDDPYCQYDVFDEYPDIGTRMINEIDSFNERLMEAKSLFGESKDMALTDDQIDTLKNLGYIK